jgi:hypothetical protein
LPMAGGRSRTNGSISLVGSYGYLWSSTVNGTNSRDLLFYVSLASFFSDVRAGGRSVRCIKD